MYRAPLPLIGLTLAGLLAALPAAAAELKDPYYGEALFHARMGDYFAALERLDTELAQHYRIDEPALDPLTYHLGDAEFSVGDFELRYRMHHRAGRAITAVLEGDVDEDVRNEAAYRLARIHFQKGNMADALEALDRIAGDIPERIHDDIDFLRASVYLATDRSADAIPVLETLRDSRELRGFAEYNLGIALLRDGQVVKAEAQLARAGQIRAEDPDALAIRDKSNLVLGTMLLESGRFDEAAVYLDRVRLDGPFSNQALLSAGWAAASADRYERAVVPWRLLADRDVTDAATQEALLALPHAYGQLDVYGRAAEHYGRALDAYGMEIRKLDASIESIREGRFLDVLVREEIRQDQDWVIRLRKLPRTPETYYLAELMASHDFQTGLQNYLDLEDLRRKLVSWERNFAAFEDMVSIRRTHYEPLLPQVDGGFRALDSRMRLRIEQHKLLRQRLEGMLTAPRPEFLATGEEQGMLADIERLEKRLATAVTDPDAEAPERLRRLRGRLIWRLHTEYHERLDSFHAHLLELDQAIDELEARYRQFVRVRQAASHSYEGYGQPLARLRTRVRESLDRLGLLMARQGRMLEIVAVDELVARRRRLESYRDDARFALADAYDRATELQAREVAQ